MIAGLRRSHEAKRGEAVEGKRGDPQGSFGVLDGTFGHASMLRRDGYQEPKTSAREDTHLWSASQRT